ncbi:hypothetical protein YC2023_023704 [Brassica napus]
MRELEPKMRELVVCVREERAQAGEGEGEGEERARAGEARARAEVCVREREREREHWVCVGDRERERARRCQRSRERERARRCQRSRERERELGDVGARRCVMEFMLLRRAQPRVLHLHREIKARFHSSFSNHCASVEPQILHCRAPSSPESSIWGSDYHDMRMDCDNQEDDLLGEDLEAMEKEDLAPVILFKINI